MARYIPIPPCPNCGPDFRLEADEVAPYRCVECGEKGPFALAQGMSAGTAKTPKAVEGEARQPGPKDAPK